jgi:chromosome segregation ATPase
MMKKAFFIVSLLGALYLAYQSLGSDWFSAAPQNTVVEQQIQVKEKTEQDSNISAEQLANMSARLEALELENRKLQAQLKQSEQNEQRLHSELGQANTASAKAQNRADDIDDMLIRASKTISPMELGSVPQSIQTEQQKRLTQQAQLREVAQRMQLAALDALNSASQ